MSPLILNYDSTWKVEGELHIPFLFHSYPGRFNAKHALEGRIMAAVTHRTSISCHPNFNLLTIPAVLTRLLMFRILL